MPVDYWLPRVDKISVEEFQACYLQPQKPCIITGLKRWAAYDLWNRSYLRASYGDIVVKASRSVNHRHPDLSQNPAPPPTTKVKFSDYVDLVWSGATSARNLFVIGDNIALYSSRAAPENQYSSLSKDVEVPELVDRARLRYVGFWLSAQGTESCMHFDANGCHNLNVQVRGKKRAILSSPDRCDLLYQYPRTQLSENFAQFSRVDPFQPDLDRFPLYANVTRWHGVLETGDALFIPAYWYHAFRHEGEANINVNFWWVPDRQLVNGLTMREVFLAALSKELAAGTDGTLEEKVAALGEEAGTLIRRLELACLHPILPGRSERT